MGAQSSPSLSRLAPPPLPDPDLHLLLSSHPFPSSLPPTSTTTSSIPHLPLQPLDPLHLFARQTTHTNNLHLQINMVSSTTPPPSPSPLAPRPRHAAGKFYRQSRPRLPLKLPAHKPMHHSITSSANILPRRPIPSPKSRFPSSRRLSPCLYVPPLHPPTLRLGFVLPLIHLSASKRIRTHHVVPHIGQGWRWLVISHGFRFSIRFLRHSGAT